MSGLPLDITMEEFKELVSKCGIVMEDDDGKNISMCIVWAWYTQDSYI